MVMMMKISKSKKELASIISENGGWRNGAEFAWYGNQTKKGWFGISKPRYSPEQKSLQILGNHITGSFPCRKPNNWHQTILSREEYFHLYPSPDADGWIEWKGGECPVGGDVMVCCKLRSGKVSITAYHAGILSWRHNGNAVDIIAYRLHKPNQSATSERLSAEAVSAAKAALMSESIEWLGRNSTLDQLLQDWRNADDYAKRKQAEADEAAAMRDERWSAVQVRAGEMGVTVGLCESVVRSDGWIAWSGGACPVPEGTLIDVRYRDGEELLGIPALISAQGREASPDFWRNDECNVDIVAYRLARP